MWLKIQIGIFLILGTAAITYFYIWLAMFMEWLYGNTPRQREQREKVGKASS